MAEHAEEYAMPAYKWIGAERKVRNLHDREISNFPGGIGFRVKNYSPHKRLVVIMHLYREDGACEEYIMSARFVSSWEHGEEKWQTHQAVLFPWESPHGAVNIITFSYLVHRDNRVILSAHEYKFARREDFFQGHVAQDDFHEPHFKRPRRFHVGDIPLYELEKALQTLYREGRTFPLFGSFTRGDVHSPYHPSHEIHRTFDRVLESRHREHWRRHYIHMALFNFDNEHVANHLIHLHSQGIEVECLGGWEQVSSADWSEPVARMRRAGIPIYGVVRNTPYVPEEGIASMHTKFIVFDGQYATSSSYNLDFHRWGENWENGVFYHSWAISLLYEHVYQAIKGGIYQALPINPDAWYNLYYSFGSSRDYEGRRITATDALKREIYRARSSIFVSMFDLGDFHLESGHSGGSGLMEALMDAQKRGVYMVILLNGFRAEREDYPVSDDLSYCRPLKPVIQYLLDRGLEILLLYYHQTPFSPLHHKFAVFDETTVVAESYNWYPASLYSDEVFSVIRDGDLARAYINEMFLMLRQFRIRRGREMYV